MKKSGNSLLQRLLFVAIITLTGCAANQQGYQKAFDNQNSLTQNQSAFSQSSESIFKIVKQTFVQQGFTIENADLKSGIVKAVRNMEDKENPEISYNIHASADISEVAGAETNVSLAASQQTILHRASTTWWHLLWILPIIPTGTEYQTLVIKEGNITAPGFYIDFFNSLKIAVTKYDLAVKAAFAKAAEKAAILKAEAEVKAAAQKAESDRIAAEKSAILKAEAEAASAAGKATADRIAEQKANIEKVSAEIAAAEKLVAEKETVAIEAARIVDEKTAATKVVAKTKNKKWAVTK